MKIRLFLVSISLALTIAESHGQVSPYSITPKWFFGRQGGLDFTGGSPVVLTGGQVNGTGQEASSTIADPNGNVVAYSDGYRLYDGTNAFKQFINGNTSSTQTGIILPDPSSPANTFYVITANGDPGGGGEAGATIGIYYYRVQKSGSTINVLSGPILLATNTTVTEQLYAGSDDNGGYWVVTHQGGGSGGNQFWAWNLTTSGFGTKVTSSVGGTENAIMWQGSIKINKCQTRLAAVYWSGVLEVYNWNNATGKVTGLIRSLSGYSFLYGCEFSPDGNFLYFSSLGTNQFYQLNIASGAVYTYPGGSSNNVNEMGTLQLGPDDKIYVTNTSNFGQPAYIGVVNNPNASGAGSNYNSQGFTLNSNSPGFWYPNIYRGITTAPWINPTLPSIKNNGCPKVNFSYDFKTYYLKNITVAANSEEWDFGDGAGFQTGLGSAPSHTYASKNTFTVKFRVKDAACNKTWTNQTSVNISCALPVEWLTLQAIDKTSKIEITWTTATEFNNSYFEIQRSTDDGITFTTIGRVSGQGTTNTSSHYSYDDFYTSSKSLYYKIIQHDKNGAIEISDIISFKRDNTFFIIEPNPSNGEFQIMTNGISKGTIMITDILGRQVQTIECKDVSSIKFGSDLPTGVYDMKVIYQENVYNQKIIKE